jgi:NhaP-type Na+/H+ or K+/H+ antiporter
MSGGDTVGEPASAVLFAFFVIVAGCALTWVLARLPSNLPYTVWVFLFGIMMARIATSAMESGGVSSEDALLRSVDQWMNIDPDLLLYTLLPPLLFDEAMKLDSHQVRMAIIPSALLALPGAAFGAYVQALVCYHWLGYDWEWLFCFMVGAVLSATDPVSVVSMLKEVSGGSTSTVKLTYLITGESLLNDGTALVIFEAIVSKHYNTDFSVVMYFVKVLLISPVLGVVLGLLTTYALRKAKRRLSPEDNTVQVALTMACAYLSFFLAQWVLGVSGIICCCAAGIIIAWLAPALIIQPEQMEIVWHTLEWVGNTMIFAIAGLIVGKYGGDIDGEVVSATFLIYVTMMLIRLSMLTICYPVVSTMSDGYSWKDVVFSTFGGLRGAISLALVLIIEKHLHEDDSYNEDAESRYFDAAHGRKAMVIICGCVFLTIVINGTFAGTFFQWLYGSRLSSDVDEIIFHYVEKRIRRKARDFLSHTDILPPFDADEVKKLCHCFSYHFSTTTHTVEEKELLDGEMSGKGHVEFEDSDSGKHKVAVLVPGRDADKEEVAKHSIFGAKLDSPTPGSKQPHSPASRSDATPNSPGNINVVRRESSASSFTSLANQLLGRKEPDSNSITVERTYSESMYRSRPSLGPSYTLNNDLIVKFRQVFHGITKHCYMRQIANGRLTRGSSVALTLLHASRHGKETCDMPGLHDYDSVIEALEVYEKERERLERAKSYFTVGSKIWNFFNQWEDTYVFCSIILPSFLVHDDLFVSFIHILLSASLL